MTIRAGDGATERTVQGVRSRVVIDSLITSSRRAPSPGLVIDTDNAGE